ncbi:MAG: proline/glycine betaine ABC transporter substrate-binding protein ProX, partial [Chloroflexota bacterium]
MTFTNKKRLLILFGMLALFAFALAGCESDDGDSGTSGDSLPGEGITVQPARATWDTGYFNEALYSRALEELGYEVEDFLELDNPV